MAMFGGPGRSPYMRQAPRLPAELLRMDARCEEGQHRPGTGCCYYALLKEGGYGEELIERELADFAALKARLTPPQAAKPAPDIEREGHEGYIASLLRRRRRPELNRERLVDRDHVHEEPPEGEDYIVVNGERISLGPRKE